MDLAARAAETISRYNMIAPGSRIGIAVSGGADSVCLLHLLRELAPRLGVSLEVVHLNHGLRGAASAADAAFVETLAREFALPFRLREVTLPAGENVEQAGREARLGFFNELASTALTRIATGHTRSDQAETVLFRILRGAGPAGLAGILPAAGPLIRPLLEIDRADTEAYLRHRGLAWREDATNADITFSRNRIRHELLPQLRREWNPSLDGLLVQMSRLAQEDERYWDAESARLAAAHIRRRDGALFLHVTAVDALPHAALRRLLRLAIAEVRGDLRHITFDHVDAAFRMVFDAEGHGRVQIPGVDVFRSMDWLRLAAPGLDSLDNRNYTAPLAVPGVTAPRGCPYIVETGAATPPFPSRADSKSADSAPSAETGYTVGASDLDLDRLSPPMGEGPPLILRNWRPGDGYRRAGRHSEEKLKFLFQNARIPLWDRRKWPIVTYGDEIVWSHVFGVRAGLEPGPGSRRILRITIRETSGDVQ